MFADAQRVSRVVVSLISLKHLDSGVVVTGYDVLKRFQVMISRLSCSQQVCISSLQSFSRVSFVQSVFIVLCSARVCTEPNESCLS